jgi:hypothetical protein
MDPGAPRGEKAVDKAVVAARLEDLDAAVALELPLAEAEDSMPKNGMPPSTPATNAGASVRRCIAMAMWSSWISDTSDLVYFNEP